MLLNAITSLIDVVRPSTDQDTEKAAQREETESDEEKDKIDESGDN